MLQYPGTAFALTLIFIIAFIFLAPKIFRLLHVEILIISSLFNRIFNKADMSGNPVLFDEVPDKLFARIQEDAALERKKFCICCVSGKGFEFGRNYVGFLYMTGARLSFITQKHFHVHKVDFDISHLRELKFYKKRLLDHLIFSYGKRQIHLHLFKSGQNQGKKIAEVLEAAWT